MFSAPKSVSLLAAVADLEGSEEAEPVGVVSAGIRSVSTTWWPRSAMRRARLSCRSGTNARLDAADLDELADRYRLSRRQIDPTLADAASERLCDELGALA